MEAMEHSLGLTESKNFTYEGEISLTSKKILKNINICYETYGQLNKNGDNAILICHALTADAHAAGYHSPNDKKPGWWDAMIGPGKAFDTNKYFVI